MLWCVVLVSWWRCAGGAPSACRCVGAESTRHTDHPNDVHVSFCVFTRLAVCVTPPHSPTQAAELGSRLIADARAAAGQAAAAVAHASSAAAAGAVGVTRWELAQQQQQGSTRPPLVGDVTAAIAAGGEGVRTQTLPGAPLASPLPQFYAAAPPSPNPSHATAAAAAAGTGAFLTSLFPHTPSTPLAQQQQGASPGPGVVSAGMAAPNASPVIRSHRLSPSTWQLEPSGSYVSVSGELAAGFRPAAAGSPTGFAMGQQQHGSCMVASPTHD